jgi:DnaK suppressor protein
MEKKQRSKSKKAGSRPKGAVRKPAKTQARPKARVKAAAPRRAVKVTRRPEPAPLKLVITPAKDRIGVSTPIHLPPDYRPTEKEPFMNPRQLEYFRCKLHVWRLELLKDSEITLESLQEGGLQEPDLADRASAEMERALELRTRDRARKLIAKIDSALQRIEDGSYGFCEETGDPISLKRLEARPIATLSIEAQERHERMERTHRSD